MKKIFIHLSDLHFRKNSEEEQGIVLNAFFKDLQKQFTPYDNSQIYLIFSGDFVQAGENKDLYMKFFDLFDMELNRIGISFNQRICVPGNHDVSQKYIENKYVEHEAVIAHNLSEIDFNNYIHNSPKIFTKKFFNYIDFEKRYAKFGISDSILIGKGWDVDENIGVYCLNTALFSSGGYKDINDKNRLVVETRNLNKWLFGTKTKIKILVMHHPLEWLNEWSQKELRKLIQSNFQLSLSGHVHDQSVFHSLNENSMLVECSAPPLLTNKCDNLGYSYITIDGARILDIQYRQWTKNHNFVTGVNFSNTDDGKVIINSSDIGTEDHRQDISEYLISRKNEALRSFSSQPIVWVEPVLSRTNYVSINNGDNSERYIDLSDFLLNPKSTIIKAPPQFGLTCLAYHIALKSWELNKFLWIYLDAKAIKSVLHLEKVIKRELKLLSVQIKDVHGIILDSWTNLEKDSLRLIKTLSDSYLNLPIIIMHTIDDSKFMKESPTETISRDFEVLFLMPLTRGHIRKVISAYNSERYIGDEDKIMMKVVTDLEVLNIHHTPLNCITLLKVSEKYFDESPVNRTKLLEMVLFLLFNTDEIPTYKTKPDLKDCEYILGKFCENLIKERRNYFSREEFSQELHVFCSEKLIDIEVDVVFDILYTNNIIISRDSQYSFRFAYWIYYFAAQRMHHDADFANYIMHEKNYAAYPEIIEFYTGIDRRRDDALNILILDIRKVCDEVYQKVGLKDGMNPFQFLKWSSSTENFEKMQVEIKENVLNSNLPTAVKDRHADISYDYSKPFDQGIHKILYEYSLLVLIQMIKASSRALRNSDYVNPTTKRELLTEIMRSSEQLSKVLFALTPLLASNSNAVFEGIHFMLHGNFGDTLDIRIKKILQSIPYNVVNIYNNDLFSPKIGPLLFEQIENETNELKKHELILMLIYNRPKNWKVHVKKYAESVPSNSFYLFNVLQTLTSEYSYSFASPVELNDMKFLIKMIFAKKQYGINKPRADKIIKIPNSVIPDRKVDD
ncbi:MAG: metallophosphoesterase [Deferribacteres bacterium]|nr:metallophosphoesterase [Deferribacteres bacterium]